MANRALRLFLLCVILCAPFCHSRNLGGLQEGFTLETVRDYLTRQEDSIVFSLIERAKYPRNPPTYRSWHPRSAVASIAELVIRESEAVQAKVGQYQNPEELPFFPKDLPWPLVRPYNYPQILFPAAASVNVSNTILDVYFNNLLPLFTADGDDGNYALTAASDLACLQALARRIHYGRFVAEIKFRDTPQDYTPGISAQDNSALLKLLTSESQEETVKKRVEKKAMVFGQDVTLANTDNGTTPIKYKVDPLVVSRLYEDWIIPLTKRIEVEYLLHRLN